MRGGVVSIDGDDYLTVQETVRLLGVKPATLYAYVSRGVLRSYRQGIRRRRLYRRAEVEALLALQPAARFVRARGSRRAALIPLAESWIRE